MHYPLHTMYNFYVGITVDNEITFKDLHEVPRALLSGMSMIFTTTTFTIVIT